ncbi:MAG: hypothetical protein R2799_15880 [Crocinitomicaceae bacterium]
MMRKVDKIIARMDVIEKHCKKMLTMPNSTPERREQIPEKIK